MGGLRKNSGRTVFNEINVTPFVDVVLVLLVIFMITAPLMYSGIHLKIPKTKSVQKLQMKSKNVVLSIAASGEFFIGKQKFLFEELPAKIKSDFLDLKSEVLYIRAHEDLHYGVVAKVMAYLKNAGIDQIALVTEIEEKKE